MSDPVIKAIVHSELASLLCLPEIPGVESPEDLLTTILSELEDQEINARGYADHQEKLSLLRIAQARFDLYSALSEFFESRFKHSDKNEDRSGASRRQAIEAIRDELDQELIWPKAKSPVHTEAQLNELSEAMVKAQQDASANTPTTTEKKYKNACVSFYLAALCLAAEKANLRKGNKKANIDAIVSRITAAGQELAKPADFPDQSSSALKKRYKDGKEQSEPYIGSHAIRDFLLKASLKASAAIKAPSIGNNPGR